MSKRSMVEDLGVKCAQDVAAALERTLSLMIEIDDADLGDALVIQAYASALVVESIRQTLERTVPPGTELTTGQVHLMLRRSGVGEKMTIAQLIACAMSDERRLEENQ